MDAFLRIGVGIAAAHEPAGSTLAETHVLFRRDTNLHRFVSNYCHSLTIRQALIHDDLQKRLFSSTTHCPIGAGHAPRASCRHRPPGMYPGDTSGPAWSPAGTSFTPYRRGALLAAALCGATGNGPPAAAAVEPGNPAPRRDIVFQDGDNCTHHLSSFSPRSILVRSRMTRCGSCRNKLPGLGRFTGTVTPDGIAVIPIAGDMSDPALPRSFLQNYDAWFYRSCSIAPGLSDSRSASTPFPPP